MLNEKQMKIRRAVLRYAFISLDEYGGQEKLIIPYIVFVVSGVYENCEDTIKDLPIQMKAVKNSLFTTNGKTLMEVIDKVEFTDHSMILTVDTLAILLFGYFHQKRRENRLTDFEISVKQAIIFFAINWALENGGKRVKIPYKFFIVEGYFDDMDDLLYSLPLCIAELSKYDDFNELFHDFKFNEKSLSFTVECSIAEDFKED